MMAFLLLHWDTLYESESLPQLSSQCSTGRRRKKEEDEDDDDLTLEPFLEFSLKFIFEWTKVH